MKQALRSYLSFTRRERIGVVALCGLLFVLLMVRTTMHYWVRPDRDLEKEQRLVKAWHDYQQAAADSSASNGNIKTEHPDSVVRVQRIITRKPTPEPPDMIEVTRYKQR